MKPSKPRRKRLVWDSSDEDNAEYPAELLASAADQDDESPAKRQKYVQAPKTKTRNRRRAQKVKEQPQLSKVATDSEHNNVNASNYVVLGQTSEGTGRDGPPDNNNVDHNDPFVDFDGNAPEVPEVPAASNEENLDAFIDSVDNGVSGFKHVHSKYCVVQGWDYQRQRSTV